MTEQQLSNAAEKLAGDIKKMVITDPMFRHLEAAAGEFLRAKGFDISTRPGCVAALKWLEEARVEEAFWEEGSVDNAANWYLGEARLEGMRRVIEHRLKDFISGGKNKPE